MRKLTRLLLLMLATLPQWMLAQDLIIAGTQVTGSGTVTSENISGTVSFDASNKNLTLDGATINGGIEWKGTSSPLTIKVKGVCSVIGNSTTPAFKSDYACNLSIARLNDTDAATLKYVGDINNFTAVPTPGVFSDFSNIVNGVIYNYYTTETIYGLVVAGITVHNIEGELGYKGNILSDEGTPKVTFDGTNKLTLNGATLTSDNTYAIYWWADADFTIELKGSNSITTADKSCIYSEYPNKNISFTQGDASNPCSLELRSTGAAAENVISIFANSGSPTMGTKLSWIIEESSGNDITKVSVAEDYKIELGGKKVHSGNASDVFGDGKVSYNVGSNTITLNGTTITGALEYAGTGSLTVALNGTNSITNTGGIYALNPQAGGKFVFVKASGATSAQLTATCGNGGTPISFNSSSLGDGLYWALTTPVTTTSIIITDDNTKMLLAPTIAFDVDKDYFATDKIAITRNDKDNISTDIFYTWGDAVIGTVYQHKADNPALTKYDGTNQVSAESGTLRAWVGYKYGTDNYYVLSEAASQKFTVLKNIADCIIMEINETESYTGSKYEPTFKVTDQTGNTILTKGTDYTVAYYKVVNKVASTTPVDMIEVGNYQIVISGIGNYGGKKSQNFEITKANLNIVTIEAIKDQPYTGSEIKPEIKVTLNDVTLNPDDYGYTVSYSNNTNVPASGATSGPTVTLTALAASKYFTEGTTKTATFNIVPKSIEGVTVTLSGDGFNSEKNSFVYNGQNQIPTITVKDGEKLLVLDTDYTLENNGGVGAANDYDVTVWGKGNYDENTSFVVTYGIAPRSIAETNVNLDVTATYVFTGGEHKPEPVVKYGYTELVKDEDYTLSYSNNINAAASGAENAPTVTITGKGNIDENTTNSRTFTIGQANLANAAISKISFGGTDYTAGDAAIEIPYTGEAIHPTVKEVTFNKGTVTLDASEYTVSWGEHNTELSSESENAQVIITSTGKNFTAGTSTSLNIKIVAANVTITAPNQTLTYNGSAQAYTSATASNENATLFVAYYTTEDDRTKGSNALAGAPTDAGTYYVQVTQTNNNFTADAKNATFTIGQLSLAGAVITLEDDELDYDGTELTATVTKVMVGDIEVPAASYEVSGNKQTEPGEYTLTVTAKANGGTFKNNFKGNATATFTIKRRVAEINFPDGLMYMTYYNADANLFIPDGVTAYIVTGAIGPTGTYTKTNYSKDGEHQWQENVNGPMVTVKKVTYLKAGVPLLLEKTDGSTVVMDPNDSFDGNKLVYVSSTVTPSGQEYVLYKNEFVKAASTIPVGKVYLEVDDPSAASVLIIGDETTGIGNLQLAITLDGAIPTVAPGTVELQSSNGVATLTVTANDGYYIEASDITVVKTINGQNAQGRRRAEGNNISAPITLMPTYMINPTDKSMFTFTVTGEKYDYEVTADFHALLDISNATVTLSETSCTYDGSAKQPAVSSVVLGQTTIASYSYNVSYENNVDVADATDDTPPTVKVTATKIPYTGEAKATFTIAPATITVTSKGWKGVYDGEKHNISLAGVPEDAEVKYGEGVAICQSNDNPTYVNAGKYVVYYRVEMPNYNPVEGSETVEIEKAYPKLILNVPESPMRLNKGDELSFNVETEPEGLPVVSSSSNEAVAIVEVLDEKGSTFRVISQGLGSACITATFEGNTNYKDASASFDVIVEGDAIQPITENQEYSFGNANDYLKPDGSENPLNGVVINNIFHNLRIDDATGYDSEEGCIAIGTPTSPENIRGAVEGFANFIVDGMAPYDPNNPLYREYQAWLEASWSGMECLVEVPKEGQIGVFTVESKEEGACQIAVQPGVGETQTFQHVERSEDGVIITPEDGRMWQDRLDAMGCGDVWRKLYGGKSSTGTENLVMLFGIFNRFTGDLARTKAIHKGKKAGINVKVFNVTYKVKSTSGIDNVGRETKILSADGWYDLRGQRISQPQQKGIYINNGRKIVIK